MDITLSPESERIVRRVVEQGLSISPTLAIERALFEFEGRYKDFLSQPRPPRFTDRIKALLATMPEFADPESLKPVDASVWNDRSWFYDPDND